MTQDTKDYLLLSEQARWAKEKGFDGECDYFIRKTRYGKNPIRVSYPITNERYKKYKAFTVPTFDQFFDWVEEKWNIEIKQGLANGDKGNYYAHGWDFIESEHLWFSSYYPTKRSARIAACEAIITYINSLPNE